MSSDSTCDASSSSVSDWHISSTITRFSHSMHARAGDWNVHLITESTKASTVNVRVCAFGFHVGLSSQARVCVPTMFLNSHQWLRYSQGLKETLHFLKYTVQKFQYTKQTGRHTSHSRNTMSDEKSLFPHSKYLAAMVSWYLLNINRAGYYHPKIRFIHSLVPFTRPTFNINRTGVPRSRFHGREQQGLEG